MLLLSNPFPVLFIGIQLLASYAFGQITQVPFDPSPFAIVGYITGQVPLPYLTMNQPLMTFSISPEQH